MPTIRLALVLGLSLTAPLFAAEKTASDGGVSFTYDDAAFPQVKFEEQKKITSAQAKGDIPDGVAPKHPAFYLKNPQDAAKKDSDYARSSIEIFPLSDSTVKSFAKSYPDVSAGATNLAAFLKKSPKEVPWISLKKPGKNKGANIPELRFEDAVAAFQTKLHYFENDQLRGVFYLTEYTQEDSFYPTGEDLLYHFAGLSKDGRFSILASFAVSHPSLPANFDAAPESAKSGKTPEAELKKVVAALTEQADDSFAPKLGELQAIIGSLKLPAK